MTMCQCPAALRRIKLLHELPRQAPTCGTQRRRRTGPCRSPPDRRSRGHTSQQHPSPPSNTTRIPVVNTDPTTGWTQEGQEITPSDADVDELVVTPKKLAGLTIISN